MVEQVIPDAGKLVELAQDAEYTREEIDAWLASHCGIGLPYKEALDEASMLHGLAYVLRQIGCAPGYKVNIGQIGPALTALQLALDHFAITALRARAQASSDTAKSEGE